MVQTMGLPSELFAMTCRVSLLKTKGSYLRGSKCQLTFTDEPFVQNYKKSRTRFEILSHKTKIRIR